MACRLQFALPDQVIYLGRKDKGASIISLVKICNHLGCLGRLILLNEMASIWEYLQLIFTYFIVSGSVQRPLFGKSLMRTLHLANHEFLVKPVSSGKK